ncbi:MAG: hypothetical protein ACOY90_16845 [Candidatus Zhuqueibacterota bacterium]
MTRQIQSFFTRLPILILLSCSTVLSASQQPLDNVSIFNALASKTADVLLHQAPLDSTMTISITPLNRQTEGNWLLESALMQGLSRNGIRRIQLYQTADSTNSDYRIEFQITRLHLHYESQSDNKMIARHMELHVTARIVEPGSGLVKYSDALTETYADSVQANQIEILENRNFSFTHAAPPQRPGLRKYIEPSLIIITTFGIVYLFFSLRSS